MSAEDFDILKNASYALGELDKFLKECSDSKFDACERELQQKGYSGVLKNLFLENKYLRVMASNKVLQDKNRELLQRPEASTIIPEKDV